MKTLNLNLHKKWFDMTHLRIKPEEYRNITPYWIKRLTNNDGVLQSGYYDFKKFDVTRFMNGMAKDAPVFTIENLGIRIGTGNPEWGAEPGKAYFIISHGKVLESKNIK